MAATVKPPAELGKSGRELWSDVNKRFDLDVTERLVLMQACRAADILDGLAGECRRAPGSVVNARGDEVANPVLTEFRQQSMTLARLIAALKLPDDAPSAGRGYAGQRRSVRGPYGPRAAS